MVKREREYVFGNLHVRLPSPGDLIITKAIAHRTKDLEDIKAIAAVHSDLDVARIQHWIEEFGAALEIPELWSSIKSLL